LDLPFKKIFQFNFLNSSSGVTVEVPNVLCYDKIPSSQALKGRNT